MFKSKDREGGDVAPARWETLDNGAQMTKAPGLIATALGQIRAKRKLITIVHKGYQSLKTVLVAYNETILQIDKPRDWPGTHTIVYILFKDDTQVWNQMKAKVKNVSQDTLYLEFPEQLVRLQRRANYRVEVPRGSKAMFRRGGEEYRNQEIRDLSADGMLFSTLGRSAVFTAGDELTEINLYFPGEGKEFSDGTYIMIKSGRIVRSAEAEGHNICYGVQFDLGHSEEVSLLQYVRQRERELLRLGVAGK